MEGVWGARCTVRENAQHTLESYNELHATEITHLDLMAENMMLGFRSVHQNNLC